MIDWQNLGFLPDRKNKDRADRERLAKVRETRERAKHKGRNHWRNWERRQMALAKKREADIKRSKANAESSRYHEQVRAYWRGERAEHP